jgi:hypothetical protein
MNYSAIRSEIFKMQLKDLVKSEVILTIEINKVDDAVPRWRKLVLTERFKVWLRQQPRKVSELIYSESSSETIKLLNRYKKFLSCVKLYRLVNPVSRFASLMKG